MVCADIASFDVHGAGILILGDSSDDAGILNFGDRFDRAGITSLDGSFDVNFDGGVIASSGASFFASCAQSPTASGVMLRFLYAKTAPLAGAAPR